MPSRPRILLIDEDPADRSLASVVLASAASRPVCEIGDSTRLIAALKDGAYDAIVTEIGIDGASSRFQIEAMRAIQETAPVIVFTHDDDPETRRRALAAGAAAFVRKSTQGFLDLVEAVRRALAEDDGNAAVAQALATEVAPATAAESPSFVLDPLPPRDSELSGRPEWLQRLSPRVERTRASLQHGIGRGVAIFLGVVAVSALVSALFGSFGSDDGATRAGGEPHGIALAETATNDGTSADEATSDDGPATSERIEAAEDATVQTRTVPVAVVAPPATESSPRPDAPVVLELRASDDVWVNAAVDGVPAFDVILTAGQTRALTAQRHVELRIGNAAGLSVIWNGKDIGRLGRPDQVRRLHFTASKVGPGPPPE